MITCQATGSVGRVKNDKVDDNMYIFVIAYTSSNGFGDTLYNMINQRLCFPNLLIEIRELNKKTPAVIVCACGV